MPGGPRELRLHAITWLALIFLGVVVAGCGADEQPGEDNAVLAQGTDWRLVVRETQSLHLERPGEQSSVRGYASPPTLDEASSFKVDREAGPSTLIAGPVVDDADEVIVETTDGTALDADLSTAHGLNWFVAETEGLVGIRAITASTDDGATTDRYSLPPSPPPEDAVISLKEARKPLPVVGSDGKLIVCPDGKRLLVSFNDDSPPRPGSGKITPSKGGVPRCGPTGGGKDGEPVYVPVSVGRDRTVAPKRYWPKQDR